MDEPHAGGVRARVRHAQEIVADRLSRVRWAPRVEDIVGQFPDPAAQSLIKPECNHAMPGRSSRQLAAQPGKGDSRFPAMAMDEVMLWANLPSGVAPRGLQPTERMQPLVPA
jgi:hypothetical protein